LQHETNRCLSICQVGLSVLKIFKHILKWSVWGIVALIVLLVTLPRIPVVQSWLAEKTASTLSQMLETDVSVGRVELGMFNRVILDGILVKDQQQSDLLRVGRLSVRIEMLPLAEGRISVSSVQLFGAHANFYQLDSLSKPNYQFVIDALSSNDTISDNTLNLRVNSLIIRHSSVSYDKKFMPYEAKTFQPDHLKLTDISAHMILKTLTEDSLNVNVKRLALKEQSGLDIGHLALKLEMGKKNAKLKDLVLQLPHTKINVGDLTATYDIERVGETLSLSGELSNTIVTPSDFACFLSTLEHYTMPLTLNTVISGEMSHFTIPQLQIQSASDEVELSVKGWVDLHSRPVAWYADLNRFHLSDHLLSLLQQDFSLPKPVARLGQVNVTGDVIGGHDGQITVDCDVRTGVGDLGVHCRASRDMHLDGRLKTDGIDLKTLLDDSDFGKLATQVTFSGVPTSLDIKGELNHFEYKNYPYSQILLDGIYASDKVGGKVTIDDPNIQTDVEGYLQRNKRQTAIRLNGHVHHFAPAALHLSDQWGTATFSAFFGADFTASSMNDAQGTVNFGSFELTDSLGVYRIDRMLVQSGYDEGVHYLKMNGDIGEAELKGNFDWATLPQSFVNFVADKLPTLPGLPPATRPTDNDFLVNLRLRETEWMKRLLGIPLSIETPLTLQADIDDRQGEISVRGLMPSFTYNDERYKDGEILVTSPTDTMNCEVMVVKQMEDGRMMDLKLNLMATENNLHSTFQWDNHDDGDNLMSGTVKTITRLYQGTQGKPETHVRILPSDVIIANTVWHMEPCDVLYSEKNLYVDHFSVANGQRHLLIHGLATDDAKDTLTVEMNQMEVSYVLDLLDFHSVEFSGEATGTVGLAGVFSEPQFWGHLVVDQFCFEGGAMGTLFADAQWNQEEQQIDIDAVADAGADAMTYIQGYVSPPRDYIDLHIAGRGTPIDFLYTYTNSFLSSVKGHATGDVRLAGPLGEMDLTGDLSVTGEAEITVLGTTYKLMGDTVHLIPNDIQVSRVRLSDRYGNIGYLTGGIHHDHLSDMTFDFELETPQLLAYDIREFGESSFYGTVFTQGRVDLHGRPGEVVINCNATPLRDSRFTYNVVSTDAISNQEFITWRTAADTIHGARADNTPAVVSATNQSTDIRINFLLNLTPDAEVRLLMDDRAGDYITLHGSGVIRASFYNKGSFQMFGTYTVNDGTYDITIQDIIKKKFTFQDGGTITFGGNPFSANLNLQAQYTVNGVSLSDLSIGNSFTNNTVRVICLMNILGQAGDPRVEFDLDLPTVSSDEKQMVRSVIASEQEMNQQVLYLLGIGRFYMQSNNNAEVQQYSQTELAMQSFLSGTLSSQINQVISQVIRNDDWNIGANISTGNEGWHNAEYEGVINGRMLNNRLLINGQFGYRDNATQANPSFIGDFDIRYLLYPNGNLALKVYNQTNDRYFTRSSLNTQGIGLILKKDFNGLGDLLPPKRRKK